MIDLLCFVQSVYVSQIVYRTTQISFSPYGLIAYRSKVSTMLILNIQADLIPLSFYIVCENYVHFQKSTAKQISNSLKRSFFCKPNKPTSSSASNSSPMSHAHPHHNYHYHHVVTQSAQQLPQKSATSSHVYPSSSAAAAASIKPQPIKALPKQQQMTQSGASTSSHHHHHHQPPITLLGGLTSPQQTSLNSDYNLIYKHSQQQQMQNGNGLPAVNSLPLNPAAVEFSYQKFPKSPIRPTAVKKVVHMNGSSATTNGTAILDDNDNDDDYDTYDGTQNKHSHIEFAQVM